MRWEKTAKNRPERRPAAGGSSHFCQYPFFQVKARYQEVPERVQAEYKTDQEHRHNDHIGPVPRDARHPQALLAVFGQQERIVRDAGDLLRFGHMVVAGHGELGRMKTASRQAVYRELRDKLHALRLRCRLLHDTLRRFDLAASLRNQPALAFLARDRAIVDDIIRRFR